jgi:hypothetical protein
LRETAGAQKMLNKKVVVFALFCLCNAQLFPMGKKDGFILPLPLEFTEMNIELGGRASKDLLARFEYNNSINKYVCVIPDGNYFFYQIYLGIKRNRIIYIKLESNDIYPGEYLSGECRPELLLELCRQKYGMEHGVEKLSNIVDYIPSLTVILRNLEEKIWNIENIQIRYRHLPKDAFERIYEDSAGGHYWYYIEYAITNP